jgi:MoaA/NifB/PqqE/SkfB family radical SAM enzyme
MITSNETLNRMLRGSRERLESRKNGLADYLPLMAPYFRCIAADTLDKVPAPICIQMQVSSTCSTHCRMCQHWMPQDRPAELPTGEWLEIFRDVAERGVRTVIFSGGEPLQREDIADLLRGASAVGLRIGLLTSGSGMLLDRTPQSRDEVIGAIADNVDWVAVSIDGTEDKDREVRNPQRDDRYEVLKYACAKLKEKKETRPELVLSATLTLQKANIGMDLQKAVRFIQQQIGIPQVNFKLATGARKALAQDPDYLLDAADLRSLDSFLWQNHLPQEKGNNLGYLRRAFADGTFDAGDVAEGVPVRSFYRRDEKPFRCFTPFVFSLIDCDGTVYPCCHLYRDNHSKDGSTPRFRRDHQMGNVMTTDAGRRVSAFEKVWNGERYVAERKQLERIKPDDTMFLPCGECTRHCQHNASLSRVYDLAGNDKALLDEIEALGRDNPGHVWF